MNDNEMENSYKNKCVAIKKFKQDNNNPNTVDNLNYKVNLRCKSTKQHNSIFKFRQIKWYDHYEYYYNDEQIIINKFYNLTVKILGVILFPVQIFIEGYSDAKQTTKQSLNQKKYGSFSSDCVYHTSDNYEKIINFIKNK